MDQIKLDNIEQGLQNPEGVINSFEKIKSPEELLDYMRENIEYGFVGKNNKRVYTTKDEDMGADFVKEYYLQTPEELLKSKCGVCYDSTELERFWFSKQKYEFKTFFLMFMKEINNNLPTHTFLAYKNNDKWSWFESSFKKHEGIHEFENINDLFNDVKRKHLDSAIKNDGATVEDYKDLKISEYKTPKYGCGADDFINDIVSNNPAIEIEE